jgi:hypothetical protein
MLIVLSWNGCQGHCASVSGSAATVVEFRQSREFRGAANHLGRSDMRFKYPVIAFVFIVAGLSHVNGQEPPNQNNLPLSIITGCPD